MKKLPKLGRYVLQKRPPDGGVLASRLKSNEWAAWLDNTGWDTIPEAARMLEVFKKRYAFYEFRIFDSKEGVPV